LKEKEQAITAIENQMQEKEIESKLNQDLISQKLESEHLQKVSQLQNEADDAKQAEISRIKAELEQELHSSKQQSKVEIDAK